MRRRIAVVSAVAVLALSTLTASAQQLAAEEGAWEGMVSFRGQAFNFDGTFTGEFEMLVLADGSVEGTFFWSNASRGITTEVFGAVTGTAAEIRFEISELLSNGVSIDGASGGGDIELTFVTCERIEGTASRVDTAAVISAVNWFAIRASAASIAPDVLAELRSLEVLVAEVVRDFQDTGSLDLGALDAVLADAERLGALLERSAACESEAAFFRSLIADDLEPLLELVVGDGLVPGGDVSPAVFSEIVLAALRAGLFGSAGSGTIYDEFVPLAIMDRIEAAAASDDGEALEIYLALTIMLGYEDLVQQAADAIVEMGS